MKSSRFKLEVTTADMLDADRADDGIEDEVLGRLQNAALLDAVKAAQARAAGVHRAAVPAGPHVAETAEVMAAPREPSSSCSCAPYARWPSSSRSSASVIVPASAP